MAKKSVLKRTIAQTKKGPEARYFIDGKRVSAKKGAARFVRENFDTLSNPWRKSQIPLLPSEQKTLRNIQTQKELFRFKGRPIKRIVTDLLIDKKFLKKDDPRNIEEILLPDGSRRFKSFGALEQAFARLQEDYIRIVSTMQGAAGFRGRQETRGIVEIEKYFAPLRNDGWTFEVTDLEGVVHKGYEKALDAIMNFELEMVEKKSNEVENVAAVGFFYKMEYDWKEKRVRIELDEDDAKEMTSDPSKATPVTEPVTVDEIKRRRSAAKKVKRQPAKKKRKTKRKKK